MMIKAWKIDTVLEYTLINVFGYKNIADSPCNKNFNSFSKWLPFLRTAIKDRPELNTAKCDNFLYSSNIIKRSM